MRKINFEKIPSAGWLLIAAIPVSIIALGTWLCMHYPIFADICLYLYLGGLFCLFAWTTKLTVLAFRPHPLPPDYYLSRFKSPSKARNADLVRADILPLNGNDILKEIL